MIYDLKARNKRGRRVAPPPPRVILSPQPRAAGLHVSFAFFRFFRLNVRNKPNLGQPGWGPQGNSAEQSQFPPRRQEGQRLDAKGLMVNRKFDGLRQNKPNFSPGPDGARPGGRGAKASNKPNSSIADCGLGTDLQPDTLRGSPGRGPVVQTNPIPGYAGWDGA
jgi:hypothetical protein